jgi:3'(2'), 5'-bisphosphate nucleotidase
VQPIDIQKIIEIAVDAGKAIMQIYESGDFSTERKKDNSPLTKADKASNEIIINALLSMYPAIPIISEENKALDYEERRNWNYCWLVDPLDGTKEFIKKNGEFTVNIALIENGEPILGVVYVPATGVTYYGEKNKGAFLIENGETKQLENTSQNYLDKETIKVVGSRSHLSAEINDFVNDLKAKGKQIDFVSMGSSLKICLVAAGQADVYPRLGPTMEWDTAAAHAIVIAAGKQLVIAETKLPLRYNKENLLNPWFLVY